MVFFITDLLGIQVPVNTIFLVMIFLLYCMLFYVYLKLSRHNEDIIDLDYEVAKLKKQIKELESDLNHHDE